MSNIPIVRGVIYLPDGKKRSILGERNCTDFALDAKSVASVCVCVSGYVSVVIYRTNQQIDKSTNLPTIARALDVANGVTCILIFGRVSVSMQSCSEGHT